MHKADDPFLSLHIENRTEIASFSVIFLNLGNEYFLVSLLLILAYILKNYGICIIQIKSIS